MTPKISVVLPIMLTESWHAPVAECAIRMMRLGTKLPYELIVVETLSQAFDPQKGGPYVAGMQIDQYVHRDERSSFTADFNRGVALATGDYIVHTAIDILVKPGWLGALWEPFTKYTDCGVSTISVAEPGAMIGPRDPQERIVEGMYGPLMMFRRGWKLDEEYTGMYSDNDLILRMYEAGLRSYRNCSAMAYHLHGITWAGLPGEQQKQNVEVGRKLFQARWGNSPLMMVRLMRSGGVVYGREHEQ